MVCVEELCSIFKNLHPHRRIELMCGLLQCCVPLELRFIGSYVENLGRRDFHYLREYELKANSCPEINKLFKASEDVIRHKLAVYLSLLHTSNSVCSKLCFELLNLLNTFLIRAYASSLTYEKPNQDVMMELLTVLVMGINHPAFTFEQRRRLYDIYRWLEVEWRTECLAEAAQAAQLAKANGDGRAEQGFGCVSSSESVFTSPDDPIVFGCDPVVDPILTPVDPVRSPVLSTDTVLDLGEPPSKPLVVPCPLSPTELQLHAPQHMLHILHSPNEPILSAFIRSPVASPEQCWPYVEVGHSPSQSEFLFQQELTEKVFIKRVEVKGSRKTDRKQEFRMEVTWSNGEMCEVYKSYQELYDFHTRLVQCYPEDASGHRQDRKLPFLSGNPHFSAKDEGLEQTSTTITNYFRKLVSLQNDILGCDHVIQFFRESPTSSPSQPLPVGAPLHSLPRMTSPVCLSSGETNVTNSRNPPGFIVSSRPSPPRVLQTAPPLSSSSFSPQRPRPFSRSPSPTGDRLPTIRQLLEDLQLSHHGDSFSRFTTRQLLNFEEDDFKMLKLSSHAQKRLKTKLGQLNRGRKLVNGLTREGFVHLSLSPPSGMQNSVTSPTSPPLSQTADSSSHPTIPPDTLYTSKASLGHLTGSGNSSATDSSPPISPRQSKTIKKSMLSKIPDTIEVEFKDLGESERYEGEVSDSRSLNSLDRPEQDILDITGLDQLELSHRQVQGLQSVSPTSSPPLLDTVQVKDEEMTCLTTVSADNNRMTEDQCHVPREHRTIDHNAIAVHHSSMSANHAPSMATNHTAMAVQLNSMSANHSPVAAELGPMSANHGPMTANHGPMASKHGPIAAEHGPMSANQGQMAAEHGPMSANHGPMAAKYGPMAAEHGPMAAEHGPMSASQGQMAAEHGPLAAEHSAKPAELPSPQMFPCGFISDPPHTFHPPYPRMYHQMYPVCPPQPAHLPIQMYHKVTLSPDQIPHCKLPGGQAIQGFLHHQPRSESTSMSNTVMTVTVNSAAYSTSLSECPGHRPSSAGPSPAMSAGNPGRTMTMQNPAPNPRFSMPSSLPSPITYSSITPIGPPQVHRKVVNSQTSNGDSGMSSPATSIDGISYATGQHINTSVGGGTAPYSPSGVQAPMISVHSSACTSCGCRGRCGVSANYSAAYGGYVHTQVNMPPVMHIPSFLPPNSNGLLHGPCLPPNCPMPFHHSNPLPNVPNGISPEQFTLHSYLSHAASQGPTGPTLWNSMLYGYNSSQGTHAGAGATGRENKPKHPTCYNCGEAGHEAHDCKDNSMESASGMANPVIMPRRFYKLS